MLALDVLQIFHLAHRNGHSIIFQWVRCRCGLVGNELADTEAEITVSKVVEVKIPYSRSDVNFLLTALIRDCSTDYNGTN